MSQDSSVSKVTGSGLNCRSSITSRSRNSSAYCNVHSDSTIYIASCPMSTRCSFSMEWPECEVCQAPSYNSETAVCGASSAVPLYIIMAWCSGIGINFILFYHLSKLSSFHEFFQQRFCIISCFPSMCFKFFPSHPPQYNPFTIFFFF